MKRLVSIGLVMAVAITLFTFECTKKPEEIKIGAILPLTGDNAVYGVGLKKGMDLAVEEINDRGGIGGSGRSIRIIYEDDQGDPKNGVSVFRKLITADKVPMVIGAMFSAVTLAIAPIAEQEKVILLSPTSSAVDLTNAGDYIFRIYPSDTYDGAFLADFVIDRLRAKSVSVIYLQVTSISAVSQVFKERFENRGGKVLNMEGYKEGDIEFRTQLIKAQNNNPDIIFIPGYLREMAMLLRQAKELGIKKPFLSISTLYDPKILELAGGAAEDVLFSSPIFNLESDLPEITNFVSNFQAKYESKPDILAGYGHDVVNIAALAIPIQRRKVTSDNIKTNLYNIKDYPGVTGKTSFDSNGDVIKDLKIMQIKGGKFVSFE